MSLQLHHSSNISGLDVVLILLNLGLKILKGDFLVFNDNVYLQLLDTETDSNKLGATPNEAVHLNGKNIGLELFQVSLIVPWLDIQGDHRFGGGLSLAFLLLSVIGQSLFSCGNDFWVFLLVLITAKQVYVFVIFGGGCGVDGDLRNFWAVGREGL